MIYKKPDPNVNANALDEAIKIVVFRHSNLFKRGMRRSFSDTCVLAWDVGCEIQPVEIVTNVLTALSIGLQGLHALDLESSVEDIVEAINKERVTMADRTLASIGPQFEFLHDSFRSVKADPTNASHRLVFETLLQSLMRRDVQEEYSRLAPGHDQSIYSREGDTELLKMMNQAILPASRNIADILKAA